MNNYISNTKKIFSNCWSKTKSFLLKNRKAIFLFLLFGFLVVFIFSFALYLFSGIGLHPNNLEESVGPKWNGVWFIDDYVNTKNEIIPNVHLSSWEALENVVGNNPGYSVAINFFKQGYAFYKMNTALLPVWIAFASLLLIVLLFYLCTKYWLKPWVIKNLEALGLDQTNPTQENTTK